jgi:hypothetical protein
MKESEIVLVSGHWPLDVSFAVNTRKTLVHYCSLHNYDLHYDEVEPTNSEEHHLHYRRCEILQRAALRFPNAKWYVWLDTDIFVNRMDVRIESVIDLSDDNILYHLFYERPNKEYPNVWDFKYDIQTVNKINSGVKFVSPEAIKIESDIWELRNDTKWRKFPYEQKIMVEKIIPENMGRIIIHDPYVLNCTEQFYPVQDGLFVHLCGRNENFRNNFMSELLKKGLNNTLLLTLDSHSKIVGCMTPNSINLPKGLPHQY